MLARFAGDIHLEKNARPHSVLLRDPFQILSESKRVDPVKQLEQRQGVTDFVLLEVTDEMPAQPRREKRNLGARFLHPIFAEKRLPGVDRRLDFLRRLRLRDRDQLDLVRQTTALSRRLRNLLPDTFEIDRDLLHRRNYSSTRWRGKRRESLRPTGTDGKSSVLALLDCDFLAAEYKIARWQLHGFVARISPFAVSSNSVWRRHSRSSAQALRRERTRSLAPRSRPGPVMT